MPPISIMLKPSSGLCNMRCKYCFYHSLAGQRESFSYGFMTLATFENVLDKALSFVCKEKISLTFQGGEPLLSGKDFFKAVFDMVKKKSSYIGQISLSLQTNGILIDGEWCQIFKDNNVLIGLSLDGDRERNALRIDSSENNTFDFIMNTANLFKTYNVDFNILTVLTKNIARHIDKVYDFFKENNFKYLQFIPYLKPIGSKYSALSPSEKEFSEFQLKLFKLYLKDVQTGNYTSVRHLDNFVNLSQKRLAEQCGMNGHCSHQFIIEGDGSVFPCDFYCLDEYKMGNINHHDIDFVTLSHHPIAIKLIKDSLVVDEKCKKCNYYALCKNGCLRERGDVNKCLAYQNLFKFALPYMQKIL